MAIKGQKQKIRTEKEKYEMQVKVKFQEKLALMLG